MTEVRWATPDDCDQLAELLRKSFDKELLPYTIYGCSGIYRYLKDTIRFQKFGGSLFVVCEEEGSMVGFSEFRPGFENLFLNNIYVNAGNHGKGIGRKLLLEGIGLARKFDQQLLGLDVFWGNLRARKWYESLEMSVMLRQVWFATPLSSVTPSMHLFNVTGMPQAETVHSAYGFSQFGLETKSRSYSIGRIGSKLFRTATADIFEDDAALSALTLIDRNRNLLCVASKETLSVEWSQKGRILAESLRLEGKIETMLPKLKKN